MSYRNSNKWISGVTVTEFVFVFQTNESRISAVYELQDLPWYLKQTNIQLRVIELDFVFYNKTVRDISKNIKNQLANFKKYFSTCFLSVQLLLIKQKKIVHILSIKTFKKLN